MIGDTISHYRILEKMGGGGMGVVYKAEDTSLKRIVALKFLKSELTDDAGTRTRFVHEAQAASALQHQNICTIHEIDQASDGRMFICMDYYGGDTLKARTERGEMPLSDTVEIAAQVAAGLAKAHEAGVVHRDIKPANIAITDDEVVKILDFGLAKLADRTQITKDGTTVGTVSYMSPEQARGGDVSSSSDLWSLGVILYEMLTGRRPFRAEHDAAVLYTIVNEPYEPVAELRDDVPPQLAGIVDRALAKDPDERYSNAADMERDLRAVASELAGRNRGTASPSDGSTRAPVSRSRVWLPMALVALIAAGFLLFKPLLFEDELISAPRPIAVISFENQTGDQSYDYLREAIPNLLITSLEQSKYLSVVTWERMHDLLRQAGRGEVTVIDNETGFEVCRMDGIDTIVLGSFSRAGDVFVTDVKVLDVHSKELLKSASAKGEGVGSILDSQIDELGKEISRGVGLSERSIQAAGGRPIATVTTSSMDAYDYFLRGKVAFAKFYWEDARPDLEKAVELDSTFAVAWLYLAQTYGRLREMNASNTAYEKAMTLSASASEKNRLYIEAHHAKMVEDDKNKHHLLLIELAQKYPMEKEAHVQLGIYYRDERKHKEAEEAFKKALALDPDYGEALNGIAYLYAETEEYEHAIAYFKRYAEVSPGDANPYDSMGELYFRMGKPDEAISSYERALALKPGFGSEGGIAYVHAFKEDWDGAIQSLEQAVNSSPSLAFKAQGKLGLSMYYMYLGQWQNVLNEADAVSRIFEGVGHRFGVVGTLLQTSYAYFLMGDYERSREYLRNTMSLAHEINRVTPWLIFVHAFRDGRIDLKEGLIDSAKTRINTISKTIPKVGESDPFNSEFAEYWAAFYRAELLLEQGSVDEAIAVGRSLPEMSFPNLGSAGIYFYNCPVDRDVLARAYVRKGALGDAIAEYERIVTFDPASKDRRLVYPLFHYRLGVLYEQNGQTKKAVQQYEKFLEICGGADPELTEVPDARRRLAALADD